MPSPRALARSLLLGIFPMASLLFATPALCKTKLAVMELQDQTRSLSAVLVESLTDSLRSMLARSGQFIVIDKSRQAAALKKLVAVQKRESYKACYDSRCQIPLGQALAADSILRTKLTRVGSLYLAIAELVDLEKEAVSAAAQAQVPVLPTYGRDDRLLQAVLAIARQLSGDNTLGAAGTSSGGRVGTDTVTPPPGGELGGTARDTGSIGTSQRESGLSQTDSPSVSAERAAQIRAREERIAALRAEQERQAAEARQRAQATQVTVGSDVIRRKRATHLIYGWMAVIGGGILAGTGLYYMFGKAGEYRDNANNATTSSELKSNADSARSAQVTGGVVLGFGGAALAAGLALIFTAPKAVQPANVGVAGMELERLPSAGPSGAQSFVVNWGGKF